MTPGDVGAALAEWLPTDLLSAWVRAARTNTADRQRNGRAPHEVDVLVILHSLEIEATRRACPQQRPWRSDFANVSDGWLPASAVASAIGVTARSVSRLLPKASRRKVSDSTRRHWHYEWDPEAVQAERQRREEAET